MTITTTPQQQTSLPHTLNGTERSQNGTGHFHAGAEARQRSRSTGQDEYPNNL